MIEMILFFLFIGFAFSALIMGIVKSAITGEGKRPKDTMEDLTNPSHTWHPLNMWRDD